MFTREEDLLHVIEKALRDAAISKSALAQETGINPSALSNQFRRLKNGGNFPIKTIFAIEKITGAKIFNF